jgi:hypothetical protein
MVNPVTGPFSSTEQRSFQGAGSYRWDRISYRQKRPYNLPLGFRYTKRLCTATWTSDPGGAKPGNGAASSGNPLIDPLFRTHEDPEIAVVRNACLQKFNGGIADRTEWLVSLIERKQAINMITVRAMQLYQFARAVKRMDWIGAGKALHVVESARKPHPNWRAQVKTPANLWLEFHFGWEPLIKDIGTSADLLQTPFNVRNIRAKKKERYEIRVRSPNVNYYTTSYIDRVYHYKLQADVQVTNPNLYLLNRGGFTNPATVAWELVPFSFVVDWFVPVSAFLGQFTEYLGLTISNPSATLYSHELCKYTTWPLVAGVYQQGQEKVAITCDRRLSLPGVTLVPRFPERLSATRAATAISLLLQTLKSF